MTDDRAAIMKDWDKWRTYIADGGGGSYPRDAFESLLDEYDEEIERLQHHLTQARDRAVENSEEAQRLTAEVERLATRLRNDEELYKGQVQVFRQTAHDEIDKRHAAEAERDRLREALEAIVEWSDAYPLKIFPEPDFKKARELLGAGNITLDAISASTMRRAIRGAGAIARAALKGESHE